MEINSFPNFIHNDQITCKVIIPFLTSVIERISDMEKSQSELIELGQVERVASQLDKFKRFLPQRNTAVGEILYSWLDMFLTLVSMSSQVKQSYKHDRKLALTSMLKN